MLLFCISCWCIFVCGDNKGKVVTLIVAMLSIMMTNTGQASPRGRRRPVFIAQSRGLEPAPEPIWAQSEFLRILETCQNTKECILPQDWSLKLFEQTLEWIKVFVVINCFSVSIVPVITVANRWRMFHRNKVRIQHFYTHWYFVN